MMNKIIDIYNSDARKCALASSGIDDAEATFFREDLTEFHGLMLYRLVFLARNRKYICYVNETDNSLADMTWEPEGA